MNLRSEKGRLPRIHTGDVFISDFADGCAEGHEAEHAVLYHLLHREIEAHGCSLSEPIAGDGKRVPGCFDEGASNSQPQACATLTAEGELLSLFLLSSYCCLVSLTCLQFP